MQTIREPSVASTGPVSMKSMGGEERKNVSEKKIAVETFTNVLRIMTIKNQEQ